MTEINEREREVTQDLKLREIELADCREILSIQKENLDARSTELLTFKKESTESYKKEQRDSALKERETAMEQEGIAFQLNKDLQEREAALEEVIKSIEKERDIAREELQVLND